MTGEKKVSYFLPWEKQKNIARSKWAEISDNP
jgi:hypothetical protein